MKAKYGLALDQFQWGYPNELQTQWLVSQGVSFDALLQPWPFGAVSISRDAEAAA
jgi:hypothetical protein